MDQVVPGCFSNELRKWFLRTETLTLNAILRNAKAVGISDGQIMQMAGEKQECVLSLT